MGAKALGGESIRKVFFTLTLTLSPQGRGKNTGRFLGGGIWGLERVVRKEDVVGGGIVAICEKMVVKSCECYKKIKALPKKHPVLHFKNFLFQIFNFPKQIFRNSHRTFALQAYISQFNVQSCQQCFAPADFLFHFGSGTFHFR